MKWFLPAIILFFLASSSYAKQIEIIYVNANVGAAAGGHVGLKLDDDVFHYQFYPDDRFLLVRESWEYFTLIYNRLRNRTIYAAGCAVSDDAFSKIKNHFSTLLASQKRDFSNRRFLLEQKQMLAGVRQGSLELPVRGLGFFAAEGGEPSGSGAALRSSLYKTLGETYLVERRKAVTDRLDESLAELNGAGHSGDALARKIVEISVLKKKRVAYDMIIAGRGLSDSALVTGMGAKLSREDQDNLNSVFTRRLQVLAHLLTSERSDIGEAILIETARCQALIDSLTSGVLVTLDPFPDKTKRNQQDLSTLEMQRYLAALIGILGRERSKLLLTDTNSIGAEMDYHYLQIENVNGRLAEIVGAVKEGQGIRVSSEMMVPSRSRTVRVKVPILKEEVVDAALASVDNNLSMQVLDFEQKYRYALIERNCVNQLLKNLNSSFSGKTEAEEALGDLIDPVNDRVVIPFDFFYKVSTRYNVEQVTRYPSRRIAAVEAMKEQGDTAEVWFREGNTVSTTVYRRRIEDTPFLFFTDDVKWSRPALGLANFAWSAAHGLAGIVTLPVRGGEPVRQALRGMFYSLPEIFFFNIRKGTYLHDGVNEGGHRL